MQRCTAASTATGAKWGKGRKAATFISSQRQVIRKLCQLFRMSNRHIITHKKTLKKRVMWRYAETSYICLVKYTQSKPSAGKCTVSLVCLLYTSAFSCVMWGNAESSWCCCLSYLYKSFGKVLTPYVHLHKSFLSMNKKGQWRRKKSVARKPDESSEQHHFYCFNILYWCVDLRKSGNLCGKCVYDNTLSYSEGQRACS